MFEPGFSHRLDASKIDSPMNALTLTLDYHRLFGEFQICFERTGPHQYRIGSLEQNSFFAWSTIPRHPNAKPEFESHHRSTRSSTSRRPLCHCTYCETQRCGQIHRENTSRYGGSRFEPRWLDGFRRYNGIKTWWLAKHVGYVLIAWTLFILPVLAHTWYPSNNTN